VGRRSMKRLCCAQFVRPRAPRPAAHWQGYGAVRAPLPGSRWPAHNPARDRLYSIRIELEREMAGAHRT
jgi:hypothetical protein